MRSLSSMQFGMYNRPFNMDAGTLERLNDKIGKSNDASIEGEQVTRFRALKEVYLGVIFKLDDKEIKNMDEKIADIREAIKSKPMTQSRTQALIYISQQVSILEEKIDDFKRELMVLLYKHGIINLKKRKDLPLEQELGGDYE